ncbi:MAG: LysR substrate-binding domain-containing protein [Actinomycetota bacterium]
MRLRQLYVAAAIADTGSVRAASELLHLTQPATSRSLRELEEVLGLELFERRARGMALTEEGERLVPQLRLLVSEVGAMLRHVEELRSGERGEVRVGIVLAGSALLLPDAVLHMKETNHETNVRIVEATPIALHDQLLRGELDVVVGRTLPLSSMAGVQVEVLGHGEATVVAAAGHPAALGATLAELVDEPWVLPPIETSLRQQIEAAFAEEVGRSPADVVECVAPMPVRRLLLHGARIGVVPVGIFADDLDRGDLVPLPIAIDNTAAPVGIITRAGSSPPPSVANLIASLRQVAARPDAPLQR